MDNSAVSDGLAEIRAEMSRMLDGVVTPYEAGWEIWGKAFHFAGVSPEVMHPLWLIWGALTDWVEMRPEETEKANSEMLRASREWLAINPNDTAAQKAYLDRWVYDEMGYEKEQR